MSFTTMCKSIARSLLLVSSFALILLIAVSSAQAAEVPLAANSFGRTTGPNFDIPNLVVAKMTVAKTDGVTQVGPNQLLDYVITFSNTSTVATQGVTLADTMPPNTTYQSCSITAPYAGTCSAAGNTVSFTINGTVAAGASGTVHVVVRTNANIPAGTITNTVILNYTDALATIYPPETASDTDIVTLAPTAPLMTVSKTDGITQTGPNNILDYVIAFSNTGTGAAANVTLADTMPPFTTYQSCSITAPFTGTCSATGNIVNFTLNQQVAPGGSGTVHVVVRTNANIPAGTITNTVVLNYTDVGGTPQPPVNATDTDIVVLAPTAPLMNVSKTDGITQTGPNNTLDYVIAFSNTGTNVATNVTLADTMPPNTTYQSCSITPPFTGTCSAAGNVVNFALNQSVSVGGSGSVHVIVTTNANIPVGSITNNVQLNYKDPPGVSYPPVNASDTDVVVAAVSAPGAGSPGSPSAPAEVPEADTLVLMASGGAGMVSYLLYELRRRRSKPH